MGESLSALLAEIANIGIDWHKNDIIDNTSANSRFINKTINDLPAANVEKALVVSAGPSLHSNNTLSKLSDSNFSGPIVAVDGAYVKCLKAGIVPEYLLTLDPHPTRLVRWFGDPDFEKNIEGDDYFSRQDLDIDFRNNSIKNNEENISLVNQYATHTKLIIASTSPSNVVSRVLDAGFDLYWWVPLVDDPNNTHSLTKKMFEISGGAPAINTGGNVGTAAWVFSRFWLDVKKVGVIGLDFGYAGEYPYEMTQTFPELLALLGSDLIVDEYFPRFINPLTGKEYYTDPTYFWYRENLLHLLKNSGEILYNCTEGGVVFGEQVKLMYLSDFLKS